MKNDVFYQIIDKDNQGKVSLKLINRKDEANTEWKHPTIVNFISKSICSYYGLERISGTLITYFNLF